MTNVDANSQAAMEQAFVLEVMGQMPDMAITRAALIEMGPNTCEAFRREPGTVATLADDMRKAGQSEEEVNTAGVIAIAAIHNLCTDQAGGSQPNPPS